MRGMRTGELASRAGVNVQTLRYYERRGLLARPERSPAGYRRYPEDAVDVVRFVKRAQELGFTLDEIADLLRLADGGPDDCDAVRVLAESRVAEIRRRIADLHNMQRALTELIATCELPRAHRSCPILTSLQEGPRS